MASELSGLAVCAFFGTRKGCKRGKKCQNVHMKKGGEVVSHGRADTLKEEVLAYLAEVGSRTAVGREEG